MALVFDTLRSQLETAWLVPEGGQFPQSPAESGDRFAAAVSAWFATAMAAAFPCATALPRRPQLAAAAAAALAANAPQAAGAQLALAVAAYIAGQVFGAPPAGGTATFPVGIGGGISMMVAAFSDLNGTTSQKAQQIATACTLLATTTQVAIVLPPSVAPIT